MSELVKDHPVYVDALMLREGKRWCHMFCEDMAKLDAFAREIGVSSYRQVPPQAKWPHYDLTEAGRGRALAAGAVEADRHTFIALANHIRRVWELKHAAPRPDFGRRG